LNLELEAYIIEVICSYRCYTLVVVEERFPDTIVKRYLKASVIHSFGIVKLFHAVKIHITIRM